MTKLKNWIVEQQNELCLLTIDVHKKHHNILSSAVIAELDQALDEIEKHNPKGLIIKSAKSSGFIAGADVSEFQPLDTEQQAAEFLRLANKVITRIESLSMPSVAMINGVCLGGGLELALACDYRVAVDQPTIRLGLPEVKLGIHPGFGGTVRLIEIIGIVAAMDLILSGRTVTPQSARKMGIIDFCVAERQLQRTAEFLIAKKAPPKRTGVINQAIHLRPLRYLMAQYLKKQIRSKVKQEHYPAPYAAIELWQAHGGKRSPMLAAEQQSVAKLMTTTTSKNLVKVFFLQQQLKKTNLSKAKSKLIEGEKFQHVHVIGGGVMGGDIAAWCVLQGMTVTLQDRSVKALARATKRAHHLFVRKLKQSRPIERAMDRFQQDAAGNGIQNADVIIEAIFENAEAKIGVFSELMEVAKPKAILATNTSSIPLETISAAVDTKLNQRKSLGRRLVGLHFFNPVANMQLIEIVRGIHTSDQVVNRAHVFTRRIGRLPVVVKSSPGFLVNRVLMPYILEAVELLKEGIAASVIDRVATNFGLPMGPITLADTVGLDVCYQVGTNLVDSFGGTLPDLLKQKVDNAQLGKKTGHGFYAWEKGQPKENQHKGDQHSDDIEDRLIFRYLNECIACLHEGIVADREQLDAALIFATGFAPFRGGPIQHITAQQPALVLQRLKQLHDNHGARFKPAEGWETIVG